MQNVGYNVATILQSLDIDKFYSPVIAVGSQKLSVNKVLKPYYFIK